MCSWKKISVEMELETCAIAGIYTENIQYAASLSRAVVQALGAGHFVLFHVFLRK